MRAGQGMRSVPAPLYHTGRSVTTVPGVTLHDETDERAARAGDARRSVAWACRDKRCARIGLNAVSWNGNV